MPIFHWRR